MLLGTGGHLIYSGPTGAAAGLLSCCPAVKLSPSSYDNVGDFIIDILGLDAPSGGDDFGAAGDIAQGSVGMQRGEGAVMPSSSSSSCSSSSSSHAEDVESLLPNRDSITHNPVAAPSMINQQETACQELTVALSAHFLHSDQYIALQRKFTADSLITLSGMVGTTDASKFRLLAALAKLQNILTGFAASAATVSTNVGISRPKQQYRQVATSDDDHLHSGIEMQFVSDPHSPDREGENDEESTGRSESSSRTIRSPIHESSTSTVNDTTNSNSNRSSNSIEDNKNVLNEREWLVKYSRRAPLDMWSQVWILFSRRVQVSGEHNFHVTSVCLYH